jgi:hypothetical protein
MQRSNMPVQAVLLVIDFFPPFHVLLVLVQTGQVWYSTARYKIYLYHTNEGRSVSA